MGLWAALWATSMTKLVFDFSPCLCTAVNGGKPRLFFKIQEFYLSRVTLAIVNHSEMSP